MERIKMLITFDFDPETGEMKCINREIINDDIKPAKKKSTKKTSEPINNSTEPQVILEDNKYIFNTAAVELMGIEPENRIDIKYEKKGKKFIPIIGLSESFGTKSGNKLTKSYSVSYRGKSNETLQEYGNVFTLEAHPEKEGIYYLIGNNVSEDEEADSVVELPKDEKEIDIDITDLVDDVDNEVTEIDSFDFSL